MMQPNLMHHEFETSLLALRAKSLYSPRSVKVLMNVNASYILGVSGRWVLDLKFASVNGLQPADVCADETDSLRLLFSPTLSSGSELSAVGQIPQREEGDADIIDLTFPKITHFLFTLMSRKGGEVITNLSVLADCQYVWLVCVCEMISTQSSRVVGVSRGSRLRYSFTVSSLSCIIRSQHQPSSSGNNPDFCSC